MGDVLLSSDILTECFCCDLEACKGQCCVEGDSGAPLTLDEVGQLESVLDDVWPQLSAKHKPPSTIRVWPTPMARATSLRALSMAATVCSPAMVPTAAVIVPPTRLIARGAPPGANPYRAPFIPYAKSVSATARVACTTTAGVCATRP